MSASDWVMIIGAMFAGIVLVINALGTYWGRREIKQVREGQDQIRSAQHEIAASADAKLNIIHDLTNSSMTALKEQLAAALARIDALEQLLADLRAEAVEKSADAQTH